MSQKIIQKIPRDRPESKTASASTARPWSVFTSGYIMTEQYHQPLGIIKHGKPNMIAGVFGDFKGGLETAKANAELICRAVNSFDDLVLALKAYGQRSDGFCSCPQDDPTVPNGEHSTQCQMARAALAKAGVKS